MKVNDYISNYDEIKAKIINILEIFLLITKIKKNPSRKIIKISSDLLKNIYNEHIVIENISKGKG